MVRRLFVIALVCVLGLIPLTATAQEPPAEGAGTSTTSASILDLKITGLEGLNLGGLDVAGLSDGISIGSLLTYASMDNNAQRNQRGQGNPFALAELVLAGQDTITASSNGQTQHQGRQADLAGIGSVSAGTVKALVEGGTARSVIDALQGNVNVVLGNITGKIGDNVTSVANGQVSEAANGVVLSNLNLGLGDLLPAGLLEQLPLPVLLDLVEGLPLDASSLTEAVGILEQLNTQLPDLSKTLEGELSSIVTDLDSALKPVDDAVNGGDTLSVTELESVISEVQGIQDTLNNLDSVLNLGDTLSLLETLESLNIQQLIDDLINAITSSQLLGLDELVVKADTSASANDSSATATCSLTGVEVLGEAAPGVDSCDALNNVISQVDSTITNVLGSLPVVGNVTDGLVNIGGLETSTSETVDNGYRVAQATVSGLNLEVGSLELQSITDTLVTDVLAAIENLLNLLQGDLLGTLLGGDLSELLSADLGSLLEGGIPGLLDGLNVLDSELTGVLDSGDTSGDGSLTDEVTGVIGNVTDSVGVSQFQTGQLGQLGVLANLLSTVQNLLSGLPLGLDGLSTPGIDLQAASVESQSEFAAAQGNQQPEAVAAPEPPEPTPSQSLPRTGGGLLALAGLVLAAAGGTGLWLRRRMNV